MRVLVATRKGLFRLERLRSGWRIGEPRFLGVSVTCARQDPRDGSIWAALAHGHWGPKLHVSRDDFAGFEELRCPAFTNTDSESLRSIHVIVPAGPAGRYHAGANPGALFTTLDGGRSWTLDEALWERRAVDGWQRGGGGEMLHSVEVHPADPSRIQIAVSCGGVYATKDGGMSWRPRNRGVPADFLPDPHPEVGQDPYVLRQHPARPEVLWQQNHCGTFRSVDEGRTWSDITDGLATRFGFALAIDRDDPGVAWTVPIDSDHRRVAPGGALVVCLTGDGGQSWRELREGLPQEQCYDIVFRQGLDASAETVIFGTTSGRIWVSEDRGERWRTLSCALPPVTSVQIEP